MNIFAETITFASDKFLQKLMVTALIHENLTDTVTVENQFQKSFWDDLGPYMMRYNVLSEDLENPELDLHLFLLNNLLLIFRQSLQDFRFLLYQHQ